jgi:hypothetical protein
VKAQPCSTQYSQCSDGVAFENSEGSDVDNSSDEPRGGKFSFLSHYQLSLTSHQIALHHPRLILAMVVEDPTHPKISGLALAPWPLLCSDVRPGSILNIVAFQHLELMEFLQILLVRKDM